MTLRSAAERLYNECLASDFNEHRDSYKELRTALDAPDKTLEALKNADKLLSILMPGIGKLVIQDFAFVNNTLLQVTAVIKAAEEA